MDKMGSNWRSLVIFRHMKEIVFLNKYQRKWRALEDDLRGGTHISAEELSELFIQLTDDLSYARTFYPESKTTQYLNELSIRVHHEIYKNKKERTSRFVAFWKTEVPLVMAQNRRNLLVAFLVFVLAFGAGWLSGTRDNTYVNLLLGDTYVNSTLENIENGKPMDIYGSMSEGPMFLYIAYNNIKVSFTYFVFGFFFSVGSLFFLFSEGLRIGAFFQLFYSKNVLASALTAVWIHGTIEISIIIIACSAGMALGNSIVFPGTYKRSVSLLRGMKDGIKIIIGLVPCFILAALLEGFVTRHYSVNVYLSVAIILASLAFILWYFVFYPMYVAERVKQQEQLTQASSAA